MIKKILTRAQMEDKKTKGMSYDVARSMCIISVKESFDFKLSLDNWTFISDLAHPKVPDSRLSGDEGS